MRFVAFEDVAALMRGKTVAIVGSGPSVLSNRPSYVDSHDLVMRVNNYKTGRAQGVRADIHYSFYGNSIRKTAAELSADGVRLCMCKCPNAKPIESAWHESLGKQNGIDFRYIYEARKAWWFGDTYVPTTESFMEKFKLLGRHIPSTGFAAILDVLACVPKSVYLTGFDFFASRIHNVDERWNDGNPADPIRHWPEREQAWVSENRGRYPLAFDPVLKRTL